MTDTIQEQIIALANDRHEIEGTTNNRSLLEEAETEGLLEAIPGRISMQPPAIHGKSIKLLGRSIPITGACYTVYKLTDKALALGDNHE